MEPEALNKAVCAIHDQALTYFNGNPASGQAAVGPSP
jgi:hypothetical protein